MNKKLRLILGLFSLECAFLGGLRAAEPEDVKAEITGILAREEAAWNAGDAEAHGADFASDGTFTNIIGLVFQGKEAFIARHAQLFRTIFKGSQMMHTVRRLSIPAENVALADLDVELRGYRAVPPGVSPPADGVLRTRLLEVFLKREGKWEIVAYHNVDVKPKGPDPMPPGGPPGSGH